MEPLNPVSICLAGDSVDADIATYLDSMLLPGPKQPGWTKNADTRNEVKTSLTRGAHGMYVPD
jgi:hypothetical protein